MANPKADIHHGQPHAVPNSNSQAGQTPPAMVFTRPFTLSEALPYTPFSSIAPFNSGMPLQSPHSQRPPSS
ncbi:hypothetical protein MYCTH_2299123 [Thermothelomyces thermophilus ATCC 42464]|uniref:Uncharacterized protein n=1 Tax=Thermothelomyces thermophilus (strain ATCC 42464 / BCRC 31852 / DSM 1799) TaxID=573729 RepID=G2Q4T0_THET4|nr:uncharacterized protein MYCTH_2299123 [Thermothelomyces thermophilus ATCC 42464]AEO55369.1 hypothetical protein MYCTH_2299123 [Thermothelomyces thermophilus ATCC 42464]